MEIGVKFTEMVSHVNNVIICKMFVNVFWIWK